MNRLTAGVRRRFFVFCRDAWSEILNSPPSCRNHTADSCGRPSEPTVASVATGASRRSRKGSGTVSLMPAFYPVSRIGGLEPDGDLPAGQHLAIARHVDGDGRTAAQEGETE